MSQPMDYDTCLSKTFESGDEILFLKGDIFYKPLSLKINKVDEQITHISSYSDGSSKTDTPPTFSAYKIVEKSSAWVVHNKDKNIFKVDLTNIQNFSGVKSTDGRTNQIGFIEDPKNNIYWGLKLTMDELINGETYNFFIDKTFLYMKTKGKNPYSELGKLNLATRNNLVGIQSYVKYENLYLLGTGAHGMGSGSTIKNTEICNLVIDKIGGSFLNDDGTRYGNGIEFYGGDNENLNIHHNIVRNVYDVAFTIQGPSGSAKNANVYKNIFVKNSQDSEIWESEAAIGIMNYNFYENVSINQGKGWGYDARPNKNFAAHILFYGYDYSQTKITFHDNYVYNPRRLYSASEWTCPLFRDSSKISSDYNHYNITKQVWINNDRYNYTQLEDFKKFYDKDKHSNFTLIEGKIDQSLIDKANTSISYDEIYNKFLGIDDGGSTAAIVIIVIIILIALIVGGYFVYRKLQRNSFSGLSFFRKF